MHYVMKKNSYRKNVGTRILNKIKFWKEKAAEGFSGLLTSMVLFALSLGFMYLVSHHYNAVEKRYGFLAMTPDLRWFPCHIEPIMIRSIKKGGAFDKAGFRENDILMSPDFNSVNAFYKSLKKPSGKVIEFEVIPYDSFKPDCESNNWGKPEKRIVVSP